MWLGSHQPAQYASLGLSAASVTQLLARSSAYRGLVFRGLALSLKPGVRKYRVGERRCCVAIEITAPFRAYLARSLGIINPRCSKSARGDMLVCISRVTACNLGEYEESSLHSVGTV